MGLNPSEDSSGATIKCGPLARTCLVEAAWAYRHRARVTQIIRERLKGLPEPIRAIAWKGQVWLASRYRKLIAAGKPAPKAIVAIARELVGFIWAIARRWCTDPELSGIRSLKGHDYSVASLRRTDFGRAHASIRLRTAQPMAASVCWAGSNRARRRGPMMDLYRPMAVSTSERLP